MKLNYVCRKPRITKNFRLGKMQRTILEFIESGKDFARIEIEEGEYASLRSAGDSCALCAKRYFNNSVEVHFVNGVPYIFKKVVYEPNSTAD